MSAAQDTLFSVAYDFPTGPLAVWLRVEVKRLPRGTCSVCGRRRVLYALGVNGLAQGPSRCAEDSGIR